LNFARRGCFGVNESVTKKQVAPPRTFDFSLREAIR
jgi:hypothetical protein